MSDAPDVLSGSGDQRPLVARLRAVIEAKDTEIAALRGELEASREQVRRLELRVAELERRLGQDSTTSGTPPSKDPIGARERRKAERERRSSERDRREDRRRGGQPGHPGAGLSRDPALDAELLAKLRERYDEAAAFGITHNRHRDWHDGNHPGYALGCCLQRYADQIWLFTARSDVEWTNNCSEEAVKAAKRHQAVSGYWHTNRTLARWCRIRSYLGSAAVHGLTTLDAVSAALAGRPWLPQSLPQPYP